MGPVFSFRLRKWRIAALIQNFFVSHWELAGRVAGGKGGRGGGYRSATLLSKNSNVKIVAILANHVAPTPNGS